MTFEHRRTAYVEFYESLRKMMLRLNRLVLVLLCAIIQPNGQWERLWAPISDLHTWFFKQRNFR